MHQVTPKQDGRALLLFQFFSCLGDNTKNERAFSDPNYLFLHFNYTLHLSSRSQLTGVDLNRTKKLEILGLILESRYFFQNNGCAFKIIFFNFLITFILGRSFDILRKLKYKRSRQERRE